MMAVRYEVVDLMPGIREGVKRWAPNQLSIEDWWLGFFNALYIEWARRDYVFQHRTIRN